jgi:hypothetical protein
MPNALLAARMVVRFAMNDVAADRLTAGQVASSKP